MAGAAIQNIKILHKRYSTAQWTNGITINGEVIVPTLAQGEIGLATDTLEVRIGTNSLREQTFAEARPIDADVVTENAGKEAGAIVTDIELVRDESTGKHKLLVTYGKLSVGNISDFPDFKVIPENPNVTAGEGEVVVATALKENSEHQLDVTYGTAATKTYVDTKFSTAKYISVKDDTTLEEDDVSNITEGQALEITYVHGVKESTEDHTIELDKRKLIIPSVTIEDNAAGDYISDITIDSNDSHKIKVARATLPTLTGGKASSEDATLVGGVSVSGHEVTVEKKTVSSGDNVVKVSGTKSGLVITADTYTKAEIDAQHNELAKAMKFAGTLDSTGANGVATLPSNAKQGDVYKVAYSDTYNGQEATVGDLFIYDGSKWRYVPSGDETFTDTWREISVNGTQVKDNSIGGGGINFASGAAMSVSHENGTITIAHNDTSMAEDLTKKSRQYVDGLTFDEYGHVTGYTVGEETVVDTNTAHAHTAGAKLEISGNGGVDGSVEYSHTAIATNTAADASKNKTITAGGSDNTFTVVDSIVGDGYGHITDVKTKEITVNVPEDKNTTYDLTADNSTADATVHLKGSDTTDKQVTFKGGDATKVSVANGIITISTPDTTYELATADLEGLIKVANVLSEAASANASVLKNYTGNNNDKLYGVNRRADGTAFVEVPWQNTTYTADENKIHLEGTQFQHTSTGIAANAQNAAVDLYAFGTDGMGHVNSMAAITTIDGNYV